MKRIAVGLVLVLAALVGVLVAIKDSAASPAPRQGTAVSVFEQAMLRYAQRDLVRARDLLKLYTEANPHNDKARLLYAKVCVETGRIEEAGKILDEMVRSGRREAAFALLQGAIAKQTGQSEAAQMLVQRAVQSEPNNAQLWRELGLLQLELGQSVQAQASIQRSLQLDSGQEDLNQLAAQLSVDSANVGAPNRVDPRSMLPGSQNPKGMIPNGMPNVPDPRPAIPNPTAGFPQGTGRPWK